MNQHNHNEKKYTPVGPQPPNGNWLCKCGIGNVGLRPKCSKCKRRRDDWTDDEESA